MSAFEGLLGPPHRLLVRGVNWLGDAVMTMPAIQRLRERLPNTHITLLTAGKIAELWRLHPAVNEVIAFEPGTGPWAIAKALRAKPFDAALVLPNSHRSALEVWLAGIPIRIGYRRRWANWLLTHIVRPRPGSFRMTKRTTHEIKALINNPGTARPLLSASAHHICGYMELVTPFGADSCPVAPTLEIPDRELSRARDTLLRKLGRQSIAGKGDPVLLGLCPGAEYGPAKRWPASNFAAAAREISTRDLNVLWLIFGGPGDTEICRQITQLAPVDTLNLAGQTSLRELCCFLKLCRVLLTNDSGPMHVAAALGTPVLALFGSTSPELTGPGLPGDTRHHLLRSGAPCSPCFRRVCPVDFRCMKDISVADVVRSLTELLAGTRQFRSTARLDS